MGRGGRCAGQLEHRQRGKREFVRLSYRPWGFLDTRRSKRAGRRFVLGCVGFDAAKHLAVPHWQTEPPRPGFLSPGPHDQRQTTRPETTCCCRGRHCDQSTPSGAPSQGLPTFLREYGKLGPVRRRASATPTTAPPREVHRSQAYGPAPDKLPQDFPPPDLEPLTSPPTKNR